MESSQPITNDVTTPKQFFTLQEVFSSNENGTFKFERTGFSNVTANSLVFVSVTELNEQKPHAPILGAAVFTVNNVVPGDKTVNVSITRVWSEIYKNHPLIMQLSYLVINN